MRKLPAHSPQRRAIAGVTLIELMVAMILGLLVAAGIITVFVQTSKSNHAQIQMARLQESGRFAIRRVSQDLRMANAQYCSGTGGVATSDGAVYMDGLRAPMIDAGTLSFPDNTTFFGVNGYPLAPTDHAYPMPSYLFMRGYDCTAATCTSIDPHNVVAAIPAMGTDMGDRVRGGDVLTLRYLDASRGWSIGPDDVVTNTNGALTSMTITPAADEPALSMFEAGDLAMLADCSNSQVFAVTVAGNTITPVATGSGNMVLPKVPSDLTTLAAPKLFDFSKAMQTVTYYLQIVSDNNAADGQMTGALMRRVNGGAAQELVRGIERLDFRYGVETATGNTVYLTAAQVDSNNGGAIACPQQPPNALTPHKGCLWRAVKNIEVHMLVDGQATLATLSDGVLAYAYPPDGSLVTQPPDDASHTIKATDQGFDRGMLRRSFSAVVSVRNYNP